MNRNANGNDFQDSNAITARSAVGTPKLTPNSPISPDSWLRNGIGESQPRMSVPTAFTNPSCGESSTCQMNVIATTGATQPADPVTAGEIAEFLRHLARFRSPAVGGDPADHAALLARKAELFARIADQHAHAVTDPPSTAAPTTAAPTTPTTPEGRTP